MQSIREVKQLYCHECLTMHPVVSYINSKPIVRCELPLSNKPLLMSSSGKSDMVVSPSTRTSQYGRDARSNDPNRLFGSSSKQTSSSKEKRFVVFHQRPKDLPRITMRDLQPLVSSLSPSITRNSSQASSRHIEQRVPKFQPERECVLEDNRCFGVSCWGFDSPQTKPRDNNGHIIQHVYYGSDL